MVTGVVDDSTLFTDHYIAYVDFSFTKLQEYYKLIDRSRMYRLTVAIHPSKRFQWVENAWKRKILKR
jgi:hypothetical protein